MDGAAFVVLGVASLKQAKLSIRPPARVTDPLASDDVAARDPVPHRLASRLDLPSNLTSQGWRHSLVGVHEQQPVAGRQIQTFIALLRKSTPGPHHYPR